MRIVIIESPYAGDIERNLTYARRACADAISRGEAPFASHLLYTQPGILNDLDPAERILGIELGYRFWAMADRIAFYIDYGMSPGMERAKTRAVLHFHPSNIEERKIGANS